MCLQLGWGGLFASNPHSSLFSFQTVFFSVATATASPLKEDFQDWSLRIDYSWTQFRFPRLGQCQYKYQIYSCIRVWDFWGLACSPSTPVSLKFPLLCGTKIMYRLYLLRSIFSTYIFGKEVVTTALYIFSVVITTDPHWSILVYYVYFWSGNHHHRLLSPVWQHWHALSVLFIFRYHHDQSTTCCLVYIFVYRRLYFCGLSIISRYCFPYLLC